MATSNVSYISDRDLQDVLPAISQYDLKRRIYNWEVATGSRYRVRNSGLVTQLFADGRDLGAGQSSEGAVDANNEWYLDSTGDTVYYYNDATSPNDMIMEAGDDWDTIKARFRKQSCRIFESKIDSRMTREIMKDREGDYPAIVIRACSLGAVILLLKAHDPTSELIVPFQEEYDEIIAGLIGGTIVLPTQITKDNSNGIIREVSVDSGSTLRPVELIGVYSGAGYELIKLKVTATGIMGTATYSVWVKDSDKLKQTQIVTDKKITGDYDVVIGTLYVRFSGQLDTSFATNNDEYEIEVWGQGIDTNIPTSISTITMTRR